METKENRDSRKIIFLEFYKKKPIEIHSEILDFSPFQHHKKTALLALFMVFVGLLLASNVQR